MADKKISLSNIPLPPPPPEVPSHWLAALQQFHPITAVIFWQVMTNTLTPVSVALARYSPELGRYTFLQAIANGNPDFVDMLSEIARDLIEFGEDDLPDFNNHNLLH